MDDLVAATVAEDGGDFTAFVPGDAADIGARIGGEAARHLAAAACAYDDRVAALEFAFGGCSAGGKQALAVPERLCRAVVDGQHPDGIKRAGDPALACGERLGRGEEPGDGGAVLDRTQRVKGA